MHSRTLSYSLSASSYNFMLKSIYIITQRSYHRTTQTETSFRKLYLYFTLGLIFVHMLRSWRWNAWVPFMNILRWICVTLIIMFRILYNAHRAQTIAALWWYINTRFYYATPVRCVYKFQEKSSTRYLHLMPLR